MAAEVSERWNHATRAFQVRLAFREIKRNGKRMGTMWRLSIISFSFWVFLLCIVHKAEGALAKREIYFTMRLRENDDPGSRSS